MLFLNKTKKLKTELENLSEKYREAREREVQQKNELAYLREVKEEHEFIESLLSKNIILDIKHNKHDVKYYVCMYNYGNQITITLRERYSKHQFPRLYAEIRKDIDKNIMTCKLIDIFAVTEGKGNGSILLEALFEYLKIQGIREVNGWLSDVDKEKFDYLEKFYEKNGFKVSFNETRTSGNIKLIL